jgi:hypothetical protein
LWIVAGRNKRVRLAKLSKNCETFKFSALSRFKIIYKKGNKKFRIEIIQGKESLMRLYNYRKMQKLINSTTFPQNMSHNFPAVNEGLLCPIRKMRSILRAQKTLAERKPHKGACADCGFS